MQRAMFFEDFHVGMKFESKPRMITQDNIKEFADLTGDKNPIHIDPEFAKNSLFGRTIGHGLLTLGVALGEWYDLDVTRESVVAFVGINNLTFKAPVFPGDSVKLRSEVTSVRSSKSHPELGLVSFKDLMLNQKGESVLEFEPTLMLLKKSVEKAN